jgi:hypothetical protein
MPDSRRVPTEKQYATLLALGGGSAGLSWGKRHTEPLLRRGWITAEWKPPYYQWVRITPDGLHALASAVEKHGLPDLSPQHTVTQRVCADCGSKSYRYKSVTAEEAMAA